MGSTDITSTGGSGGGVAARRGNGAKDIMGSVQAGCGVGLPAVGSF